MLSHDETEHVGGDDGIDDQSSSFANSGCHEAEYELEAVESTTAGWHVCEGLEGEFISFDQHALMYQRLID
jgi:hypothetical protein